jgi:hypothetical protein
LKNDNAMIREWFNLSEERRRDIFNQTSLRAGLPPWSVEKDWWASMVLQSLFDLDFSDQLVFKGGTSLSKGWNLIQRFSEDIDVAINMNYLGYEGDPTLKKITKLRKASFKFTRDTLCKTLNEKLEESGFKDYKLEANVEPNTSTDPHSLNLHYNSLTQQSKYISPSVKLEVSARSLLEPAEERDIQSFVGGVFPGQRFADPPRRINTVIPRKTFLEKAFLLHEEFQRNTEEMRSERMSRHLYDLERMIDTHHCSEALKDNSLYLSIIQHRATFTKLKEVDYDSHQPEHIDFVPPEAILNKYKRDYTRMQESMIYGESLPFDNLINRIIELRSRFRQVKF